MSELNFRQQVLYHYLLGQADKWMRQEDIAKALPNLYAPIEPTKDYHNTRERHILTKDIRAINNSNEIQKVIISSGKGIKIANEAEWEMYIRSEYKSVFSKLKRVRRKEKKGLLNGQSRLVFDSERDIIEAFIKEV